MNFYLVEFSPLAEKELEESYYWYEERSVGLGNRFIQIIDHSINIILSNPESFAAKKGDYRELVVDKFPYVIVYEIVDQTLINILHVFHTSRNPKLKYKSK